METKKSKKISELQTLSSISKNKSNTWFPSAQYDKSTNSYSNVAISLEAITNYCNSYSSYWLTYTLNNCCSKDITYITYNNTNNIEVDDIISYCSTYTNSILQEAVEKISYNVNKLVSNIKPTPTATYINNSKKISELDGRSTITYHKDHSWLVLAQYDSRDNTYHNIAMNLKTIVDYCNTYSSKNLNDIDDKVNKHEDTINKILNSYIAYITYGNNIPPAYIMSYCSTYTSYLIHNAVEKISNNMVELINKIKNPNINQSYNRNNSKKISELTPRDTITYHKDHSWFALAQYDSRIDSYVNIAMNLDTITGYCNSYSSYINSYNTYVLDNKISYLKEQIAGSISYNIISYAFSYSKDYFEWQFL